VWFSSWEFGIAPSPFVRVSFAPRENSRMNVVNIVGTPLSAIEHVQTVTISDRRLPFLRLLSFYSRFFIKKILKFVWLQGHFCGSNFNSFKFSIWVVSWQTFLWESPRSFEISRELWRPNPDNVDCETVTFLSESLRAWFEEVWDLFLLFSPD
jgi:hypothetical protein